MRRGIRIETFVGAGRYQHKVYDQGVDARNRSDAVSNELVEAQKRVNERLYDEMPTGSGRIVSTVTYQPPQAGSSFLSRAWRYFTGR